jgi:hypothetical protein
MKKQEGNQKITIDLAYDDYLTITALKKHTGLSYSKIIEKIFHHITHSKSINSVVDSLFSDQKKC